MSRVAPSYFRDLAETVESLTAPNPEFDREIWETICQETGNPYHLNGQPKWPNYTASLDAAMTLVPDEWGWCAGAVHGPNERPIDGCLAWAEIWKRGRDKVRIEGMAQTAMGLRNILNAATPTLALTAAALRARATERGGS